MPVRLLIALLAFAAGNSHAGAQQPLILNILSQELDRNFNILKEKADPPPYFVAYQVTDTETHLVSATLGAVTRSARSRVRVLDTAVRVGTPDFDNYHVVDGERPRGSYSSTIVLDDKPLPIQRVAWRQTDLAYQGAVQRLIQIKTRTQMKADRVDKSGDFTSEEPSTGMLSVPAINVNREDWAKRLRKLSAEFTEYSGVLSSEITFTAQREMKSLVNTENTRIQHGRTAARIVIVARGKAADGQDLVTMESFEATDPAKLPSDLQIREGILKVATQLTKLLRAQDADPYVGPAILSGRAAAVFFHEIFGHRIEGHRQKDDTEGQTFGKQVGGQVLPSFLSVIFDPTLAVSGSNELMGSYAWDDEGVKSRRVVLVDKGTLKTFLMSRNPLPGFEKSNGHGRREAGLEPVARQSNLLVVPEQTVSDGELRKMLIAEITRQKKPYGLFFEQVTGGYTTTGRRGLQAFTVMPLVVYKVYGDGRADELVRGVDIVGTPLASFEKIIAAGNTTEVFNGYCGAESGSIPVSAVSPALLVGQIETQRKANPGDRPPFLPRPIDLGVSR